MTTSALSGISCLTTTYPYFCRTTTKATDLANVKASGELRGRALSQEEIDALIESCFPKTPLDLRDAVAIALLRIGGMRRQEFAHLTLADLDLLHGSLIVRRGKGGKRRVVYLSEEALAFLR
ncbi:tyrosine-type recombinase/integrase, partial [Gloeocapsopsis crepidinum LEGE 06123]